MKKKDQRRKHPDFPKTLLEKKRGYERKDRGHRWAVHTPLPAEKAKGDNATDVIVFTSNLF